MPERFLPYGRQSIDEADIEAVVEVLRGDMLTTGPTVGAFEEAFAEVTGAPHAVSCANGTAALHLAALALGLGVGDTVIVPAVTFLATANAARYVGAEVAFADVDPETGLLTPGTLRDALDAVEAQGGTAAAVFPVHLNGQCCDMPAIARIARDHDLSVVEDACHALGGAQHEDAPVGATRWSDMATFSFHPVKTIACGEGGMVTTADAGLAERLARFRNHGIVREADRFETAHLAYGAGGEANPWYYEMPEFGFNYRLSDIHAALGLSQLAKLRDFAGVRSRLVASYDAALVEFAPMVRPVKRVPGQCPAWHLYAVLCDFAAIGRTRGQVMTELRARGIGTQVHYLPVAHQPYYRRRYGTQFLPGADAYYAKALSLPLFATMMDNDVLRVVASLGELLLDQSGS
ncbi:MAG TPA: UDP-4-amino-4,6-dideoxy-N-acetyl-beta-L-altrosamine transaminase [Methyloceanibacter sp.]|nr:UDP-4-amino-4,6-dideoxy-N-acetyl-beta-L-altrosamine transaminase [Methyloceanibacter sp.]